MVCRAAFAAAALAALVGTGAGAAVGTCAAAGGEGCEGDAVAGASMLQARRHHAKVAMVVDSNSNAKLEASKWAALKKMYQVKKQHRSLVQVKHRNGTDCSACPDGCLVHSMCFLETPDGRPATYGECWNQTGVWCGDLPEGVTPPAPPSALQWCASPDDFNASKPFGFGWCEFYKEIKVHECDEGGCYGWTENNLNGTTTDTCYCYSSGSCEALAGEWHEDTCEIAAMFWERDAMEEANRVGSCDGIQTEWGGALSRELKWQANQCCRNGPATFCEPHAKVRTPCKDIDDFDADKVMYGWCDLPWPNPMKEECEAAGCNHWQWEEYSGCSCEAADTCVAANGTFHGTTCNDQEKWWVDEGEALKQAEAAGSCAGIELPWSEPLDKWAEYNAQQCCKSFPATACADGREDFTTPPPEVSCGPGQGGDDVPDSEEPALTLRQSGKAKGRKSKGTTARSSAAKWASIKQRYQAQRRARSLVALAAATRKVVSLKKNGSVTEECAECTEGCIVGGMCHFEDPMGNAANYSVCFQHFGKWCGDLPAGVTAPEPPSVLQWCKSPEDFNGSKPYGEGFCEFTNATIHVHECDEAGCMGWEDHWSRPGEVIEQCHCHTRDSCHALGGSYNQPTCEDAATYWERTAVQAANEAGSCDGVTMEWGEDLTRAIKWQADMCCESFPATFCDKEPKVRTPCKDSSDFDSDKVMYGWCDLPWPNPKKCACEAAGCNHWSYGEWEGCSCENEATCVAAEGTFHGTTCAENAKWWVDEGDALKEAETAGSCDGVMLPWSESLSNWAEYQAMQCCKSYPKTACAPDAQANETAAA
mmetsp:Transcript_65034/g.211939  ORF Transcript_65034/g.211939 Transcript_65034/m.211939 type:complete len:819 (-) Transcript_65034:179-2635(-)